MTNLVEMRSFALFIFLVFSFHAAFSQRCTNCSKRGGDERRIGGGVGQEFSGRFLDPTCMHYVQFAVYPKERNCREINAPEGIGRVWLIEHPHTIVNIRGAESRGAYYIVKPFLSKSSAIAASKKYKSKGFDSWYNPELTASDIQVVMVSY